MMWLSAVRSLLFVVFLAVTVVPWALAVLLVSIFARGNVVYWMCAGWLATAIWGARVICGVRLSANCRTKATPTRRMSLRNIR